MGGLQRPKTPSMRRLGHTCAPPFLTFLDPPLHRFNNIYIARYGSGRIRGDYSEQCSFFFFCRVLQLPHPGTRICPLCDGDEGLQRRWAIVCGSPQSQLTECMTMYPLIVVFARPIPVAVMFVHIINFVNSTCCGSIPPTGQISHLVALRSRRYMTIQCSPG